MWTLLPVTAYVMTSFTTERGRQKKCTRPSKIGVNKYNPLFSFLNNWRENSGTRPESQAPTFSFPNTCPLTGLPSWDHWISITTQQKPFTLPLSLPHMLGVKEQSHCMLQQDFIVKRRTFHQDHQIVKMKKIIIFRLKTGYDT